MGGRGRRKFRQINGSLSRLCGDLSHGHVAYSERVSHPARGALLHRSTAGSQCCDAPITLSLRPRPRLCPSSLRPAPLPAVPLTRDCAGLATSRRCSRLASGDTWTCTPLPCATSSTLASLTGSTQRRYRVCRHEVSCPVLSTQLGGAAAHMCVCVCVFVCLLCWVRGGALVRSPQVGGGDDAEAKRVHFSRHDQSGVGHKETYTAQPTCTRFRVDAVKRPLPLARFSAHGRKKVHNTTLVNSSAALILQKSTSKLRCTGLLNPHFRSSISVLRKEPDHFSRY